MSERWYVCSRGPGVSEDYAWRPIGQGTTAEATALRARGSRGHPVSSLLDEHHPGLLLFTDGVRGLVLVVTGLVSDASPSDSQNRTIRASLLGVADPGDERGRRRLLGVAALTLRDELADRVPVSYDPPEKPGGLSVTPGTWHELLHRLDREDAPDGRSWTEIASAQNLDDDPESRRQVAADLAALQDTPDRLTARTDQVIVIRSALLDRTQIGELRPWRCLSDPSLRLSAPSGPGIRGPGPGPSVSGALDLAGRIARTMADSGLGLLRSPRRLLPAVGVCLVVTVVIVLLRGGDSGNGRSARAADSGPPSPTPSPSATARVAGDSLDMLTSGDRPPDLRQQASETITWRLRNAGSVAWTGRWLMRAADRGSTGLCLTSWAVPIGETPPGATVTVTAAVTAQSSTGTCRMNWRIIDHEGNDSFPGAAGLTTVIKVRT